MKNDVMQILITNVDLINLPNNDTGEITELTRITYLVPKEQTEKSKGYAQLCSYIKGNYVNVLEPTICSFEDSLDCTYSTVVDKNRLKIKIKTIDDISLS